MGAMNLDAMAGLQADELQKLIKSLQGLAAARQEPTQQPPMQTETAPAETTSSGNILVQEEFRQQHSHM